MKIHHTWIGVSDFVTPTHSISKLNTPSTPSAQISTSLMMLKYWLSTQTSAVEGSSERGFSFVQPTHFSSP